MQIKPNWIKEYKEDIDHILPWELSEEEIEELVDKQDYCGQTILAMYHRIKELEEQL